MKTKDGRTIISCEIGMNCATCMFNEDLNLTNEKDYCTNTNVQTAPWYAVMRDRDDDDWGTGSHDLEKAKTMCREYGPDAYIAVIEESDNPVCIDEIEQADF